jgi:hypothetical protein
MTHADHVLDAIKDGVQTLWQIADYLGVHPKQISGVLFCLAREGHVYRTTMPSPTRSDRVVFRYRFHDDPEVVLERQARVERMREWIPSALAEMRRAS